MKARTLVYTTVDFINSIHFGYTKFIRHHKIESNTRENCTIERFSKHEMCDAALSLIQHTVLHANFFISRIK